MSLSDPQSSVTSAERPQIPARPQSAASERAVFMRIFWAWSVVLMLIVLASTTYNPFTLTGAAVVIISSALVPIYLWCRGKALGLPLFPLFSLTFIWTHGLQLLINPSTFENFPDDSIWLAAETVSGFLLLGTFVWFLIVRRPPAPRRRVLAISEGQGDALFLAGLAISVVFIVVANADWLKIPVGIFSIVRGSVLALNVLSIFALSYRFGAGQLTLLQKILFVILGVLYCACTTVSLFLVAALSTFLMIVVGYTLGRGKVPWMLVAALFAIASLLHTGKSVMRDRYWSEEQQGHIIEPWKYPALYAEWFEVSLQELTASKEEEQQSILARSSTLNLLLFVQAVSPRFLPFMEVETYRVVPEAMVPRFLLQEKVGAHEGNVLMNMYYGKQTREAAETTTIGWGLLNEAYANFGLAGCAMLAAFLAVFYGVVTRWSINLPLLSLPNLLTMLIMSFAIQTEYCATVFASSLFQSSISFVLVVWVFMKWQTLSPEGAIVPDRSLKLGPAPQALA